jgi:hypothetical protein
VASRADQPELRLRIVVRDPIAGVVLRMQSGRTDLVPPTSESGMRVVFDFSVRAAVPDGDAPVNFLGPFTQGPPGERFVYINAGRQAGQSGTAWDRRAKIPLKGIGADLVRRALASPGGVLEVSIAGRGKDGGPVCATVKLPPEAWQLQPS